MMTPATTVQQYQTVLQEILQRLIESYAPQQVILFGSLAYGQPDEDSDIDLLIVKETHESPLERRLQCGGWSLAQRDASLSLRWW